MLRSLRDSKDVYDEVVNKYWLANYVRTCESYDWYTISDQLEACKLMSEDTIAKQQDQKARAADAPLNILKDTGKIAVKISSIVILSESTAQIRFTSEKQSTSGDNFDNAPLQNWIATIALAASTHCRRCDRPGQTDHSKRRTRHPKANL